MSGFNSQSEARARTLAMDKLAEAEKKLKGFFGMGVNHEEAADLLRQAGHQFKAAKDYQAAGSAYLRAAELYRDKVQSESEAAMLFSDAVKTLRQVSTDDAIAAARQAIDLYRGAGRFAQAGRLTSDIAEMYEQDGDRAEAIMNYQEAYEIHMGDNQPQKAHKWLEKVGELSCDLEDYQRAGEVFEAMADFCLNETRLQQMSAKGWYFKAWMCHMALDSVVGAQKAAEYQEKDYNLAESREAELMNSVVSAVEAIDQTAFTEAVANYDKVARMTPVMYTLLLKIREPIETEEEEEQADVPDLDALNIEAADDDGLIGEDGELDLT